MKKRKVLGGVLFSLALITLITLIMFFRENTISKFVNSETIKEFTSECKTKNQLNFRVEDEEYFPCELVINDEKLYLQKRNNDYKIVDKYEIVFEKDEIKKKSVII